MFFDGANPLLPLDQGTDRDQTPAAPAEMRAGGKAEAGPPEGANFGEVVQGQRRFSNLERAVIITLI